MRGAFPLYQFTQVFQLSTEPTPRVRKPHGHIGVLSRSDHDRYGTMLILVIIMSIRLSTTVVSVDGDDANDVRASSGVPAGR